MINIINNKPYIEIVRLGRWATGVGKEIFGIF